MRLCQGTVPVIMQLEFVHQTQIRALAALFGGRSLFLLSERDGCLTLQQHDLGSLALRAAFLFPHKERFLPEHRHLLGTVGDHLLLAYNGRLHHFSKQVRIHLRQFQTKGKHPYILTKMLLRGQKSDATICFCASGQRNIYLARVQWMPSDEYTKLKLPSKVEGTGLFYFDDNTLGATCSDGAIRVFNLAKTQLIKEYSSKACCVSQPSSLGLVIAGTESGELLMLDQRSAPQIQCRVAGKIVAIEWLQQEVEPKAAVMTSDYCVRVFALANNKLHQTAVLGQGSRELVPPNPRYHLLVSPQARLLLYSLRGPSALQLCLSEYIIACCSQTSYLSQPQPARSLAQWLPDSSKQVQFSKNFYTLRDGCLTNWSLESLTGKQVLQFPMQTSKPRLTSLTVLPSSFQPVPGRCLLVTSVVAGVGKAYVLVQRGQQVKLQQQLACSIAVLLGNGEQVVLMQVGISRQDYKLSRVKITAGEGESQLYSLLSQQAEGQLGGKVQAVFRTGLRNGAVVLYKMLKDNILRLSANSKADELAINLAVLPAPQLKLQFEDILIGIQWLDQLQLAAVLCHKRILFVDSRLTVLAVVRVANRPVSACFVGHSLLFWDVLGVYQARLDGSKTSLYSFCQSQQENSVARVMCDRILLLEKEGKTKLRLSIKSFCPGEPLLSGYLASSLVLKKSIDLRLIRSILLAYGSDYVNPELQRLLKECKQEVVLSGIRNAGSQSPLKQIQNCLSDPIQIAKNVQKINVGTDFQLLAQDQLETLEKAFWSLFRNGFPRESLVMAQILKDEIKVALVLQDRGFEFPVNQGCRRTLQYQAILLMLSDGQKPISLKEREYWEEVRRLVDRLPRKQLPRNQFDLTGLQHGFGSRPFVQIYRELEDGERVSKALDYLQSDSVEEHNGLVTNFQPGKIEGRIEQCQKDDQYSQLKVYFRFDEGRGSLVEDTSLYENHAAVLGCQQGQQQWFQLPELQPMEQEDKWGKKVPQQFSVRLRNGQTVVKQSKKGSGLTKLTQFTIELWVKPFCEDGLIILFDQELYLGLQDGCLTILHRGDQIEPAPPLKLVSREWNFLSLSMKKDLTCEFRVGLHEVRLCSLVGYKSCFKKITFGSENFDGEITEFRLWSCFRDGDTQKDQYRTPLGIVAEQKKKKKLKVKKKKSEGTKGSKGFFFANGLQSSPVSRGSFFTKGPQTSDGFGSFFQSGGSPAFGSFLKGGEGWGKSEGKEEGFSDWPGS